MSTKLLRSDLVFTQQDNISKRHKLILSANTHHKRFRFKVESSYTQSLMGYK